RYFEVTMPPMPRRLVTFWRSTTALIALIVVAATALSYFSYEYAHEMAQRGEESIVSGTRIAAQERVARIDNLIRDSDALMFAFVDVGNLKELPRRWSDFGRSTPTIESVIVLNDERRIAPDGFVSKKHTKGEVEAFRFLFEHHILNDLGLPALADREERRLHREYGGRYYLLSYTRRDVG